MTATIQALIDTGDRWLDRAERPGDSVTPEDMFAATMASAYFLRAQIAQRQETAARGRAAVEQLAEAQAKHRKAQLEGGAP
jgi:hypothetical protein